VDDQLVTAWLPCGIALTQPVDFNVPEDLNQEGSRDFVARRMISLERTGQPSFKP